MRRGTCLFHSLRGGHSGGQVLPADAGGRRFDTGIRPVLQQRAERLTLRGALRRVWRPTGPPLQSGQRFCLLLYEAWRQ